MAPGLGFLPGLSRPVLFQGSVKQGKPRLMAFPYKARGPGFEPRFTASKAAVLPLDDPRALYGI